MAALHGRDKIEGSFAARLSKLMGKHRREIADMLGDPPNAANIPESFWESAQREMDSEAMAFLLLIFMASADQHSQPGVSPDHSASMLQRGGIWAKSRAGEIATQYRENSRKYLEKYVEKWNNGDSMGTAGATGTPGTPGTPATDSQIQSDLVDLFGPVRAERIAVTETTRAAVDGSEVAMEVQGLTDPRDIWYTMMDRGVCKICIPYHKEPRVVWQTERPSGPPIHERCRCHIEYANDPMFLVNIAMLDAMLPAWFEAESARLKFAKFGRSSPLAI